MYFRKVIMSIYISLALILFFAAPMFLVPAYPYKYKLYKLSYYESDNIKKIEYCGFIFLDNGTLIEGKAVLIVMPLNNSFAEAVLTLHGSKFLGRNGQTYIRLNGNVTLSIRFIVDKRYNYAWLDNATFIGFFPFYIFPALSYNNVTRYKLVYLGETLKVDTLPNGKPATINDYIRLGQKLYRIVALELHNSYADIEFVYHYPVRVNARLPIDGVWGSFQFSLCDRKLLDYIVSIDDYPSSVTYIDWRRLVLIVFVFAGAAYIAYTVILARRRR